MPWADVSVLFNEPKLLKSVAREAPGVYVEGFSALQRAEIAEISITVTKVVTILLCFSALQRAEIAEIEPPGWRIVVCDEVSVLFNEPKLLKCGFACRIRCPLRVSVLFNEPKLLKSTEKKPHKPATKCFSALQRAEIAEIYVARLRFAWYVRFQCSSTSRNC